MKRRGFIFTLDALLSLLLVMMFVTSILTIESNTQVYTTYMREQDKHMAENALTILRTVSLKELVPPQKIQEWLANGVLNTTLVSPDMSPLDIVSTYWATEPLYPSANLRHKAEIILGYVLNTTLKGYYYELLINNYTSPYLRRLGSNYSKVPNVSPATLTISGYAYNQTPRGYVARAFLSKIRSRRTTMSLWGITVSTPTKINQTPWGIKLENPARIKYILELPSDANVSDAKLVLEPLWAYSKVNITVNGMSYSSEQTIPEVIEYDITNLGPGTNEINLSIMRPPEGGDDGATHIFAEIVTNQTYTIFKKRIYFPEVKARGPIKCQIPVYLPHMPNSMYVYLNLSDSIREVFLYVGINNTLYYLGNKTNTGGITFSWSDIQNGLSSNNLSIQDLVGKTTYFIVEADPYFITSPLSSEEKVIYGTSYFYVDYLPPSIPLYMIPITVHLSGASGKDESDLHKGFFRNITYTFQIPTGATPIENKYIFSWFYSLGWAPYTNVAVNGLVIYSTPPQFMQLPFTRFQYYNTPPLLTSGTNNFSVEFGKGYYVSPDYTYGELTYLVQGFVPYGKPFEKAKGSTVIVYYDIDGDNSPDGSITINIGDEPSDVFDPDRDAVDDALVRLLNNLNFDHDVNPGDAVPLDKPNGDGSSTNPIDIYISPDITFSSVSLKNIPQLTSPISITLRVWRED